MNFLVRKYINDDYQRCVEIWEATGTGGAHRGDNQNSIKNTLQLGGELFVLIENLEGKIIGTSWITNDGRRLYMHHFAILHEYQSKGLSHLLMEESLKFAKQKNMQIKLEVHKDNEIALNLYKKYGFGYLGDYQVYIIRDLSIIKK
jgi:ribosomal protein S18 acetylase RimI-like enzyme